MTKAAEEIQQTYCRLRVAPVIPQCRCEHNVLIREYCAICAQLVANDAI